LVKIFFLLFFISCANQPRLQSPAQNFLTSETQGKFLESQFSFSHLPGATVNIDIDEDSTQEDLSVEEINNQFAALLQTGLFRNVDFFTRVQPYSPILLGLKMQIMGRPKLEAEYKGNSLSLFMGLGRMKYYDQSGSNLSQSTSGDYEFNRSHNIAEYGFVYGHRLYSDILLYTRYTIVKQSIIGDIKYPENSSMDGERIDIKGSHTHYTIGSMWYTKRLNIGLEVLFAQYDYEGETLNTPFFTLILGKDFN
tara:strand:- start:84414 stop:85169 length:756 start_codon:yes stop_codon:yes gene_type:complete